MKRYSSPGTAGSNETRFFYSPEDSQTMQTYQNMPVQNKKKSGPDLVPSLEKLSRNNYENISPAPIRRADSSPQKDMTRSLRREEVIKILPPIVHREANSPPVSPGKTHDKKEEADATDMFDKVIKVAEEEDARLTLERNRKLEEEWSNAKNKQHHLDGLPKRGYIKKEDMSSKSGKHGGIVNTGYVRTPPEGKVIPSSTPKSSSHNPIWAKARM